MGLKFDDLNELWHALRMQALGATYAQDAGDEDDYNEERDREARWKRWRFVMGPTRVFYAAERVPSVADHDPGDEQPELRPRVSLYMDSI